MTSLQPPPTASAVPNALWDAIDYAHQGRRISRELALSLADASRSHHPALWAAAAQMRDLGREPVVTYSRKVFLPLTNLCRDVCSYCTFAKNPDDPRVHTMSPDEVMAVARAGERMGCKEALFCLGDRPEARWPSHREVLKRYGHTSTHGYLVAMCKRVIDETGLLPHPNAGVMSLRELAELKEVSASQGLMLETVADRLCGPGGPHEHAPDKRPSTRLAVIRKAGQLKIPFTTGILIGIGETPYERIQALLALRELQDEYGHIQEIIVQNFRAKENTAMAAAGEPGLIELMTTCAIARLILGPDAHIQAPPNLSADYGPLLLAGIDDWGGISPLTPDFINPEAPWPNIGALASLCQEAGYRLTERLTIYPDYIDRPGFVSPAVQPFIHAQLDSQSGLVKVST